MSLPPESLKRVRDLLKDCTAEVRAGKGRTGTGFFITDRHLLTCAHVAGLKKGAEVEVTVLGRAARRATVIDLMPDPAHGDLALLEAERAADVPQPAAVLDRNIGDDVKYYAVGYPFDEQLHSTGLLEVPYTGSAFLGRDSPVVDLLKLHAGGATIVGGLSGSPILSSESGAVVAIMQYSVNHSGDLGGGAIPIARAAERFELVRECIERPPLETRLWRDSLSEDAWLEMHKPPVWEDRIDLTLSGNHRGWSVTLEDGDERVTQDLTMRDLPADAAQVLFRWSQQRGVNDREDALFLGRMLAAAIFPEKIAARLRRHLLADDLVVRLHIDEASEELFGAVWEDAILDRPDGPGGTQGGEHISIAKGMRLIRVADGCEAAETSPPPAIEDTRVIGVVIQPPKLQAQMPVVRHHGQQVRWPSKEGIATGLRTALQDACIPVEVLPNPSADGVSELLESCPPGEAKTVVHYIGFGREEDGKPLLALGEAEEMGWRQAGDLFAWTARCGARLLVVELLPAPKGESFEPISPRAFLPALTGHVEAVLFTRFGVHPRALLQFNSVLYMNLAAGETVEVAVQRARRSLHVNQILGDEVGFGYFPLISRAEGSTRIVQQSEDQSAKSSVRRRGVEKSRPSEAVAPPPPAAPSYQGAA